MLTTVLEMAARARVAIVAFAFVSCGGKASSEMGELGADGRDAGALSDSAGADELRPTEPQPSTVRVSENDADIDRHATAQCLQGFQGFSAQLVGMRVDLMAFVFAPGDYEGDSVQILWLDALLTSGEHYQAAAGTVESHGNISLHVEQVQPRFMGRLVASLPAVGDPVRAPLMLALTFDIAPRAGCH